MYSSKFCGLIIYVGLITSLLCLVLLGCQSDKNTANTAEVIQGKRFQVLPPPASLKTAIVNGATVDDYSPIFKRADECCTEPGQSDECWQFDAELDGVTCYKNADCPSGSCDMDKELCQCVTNDDCNSGVCTDEGVCGPSWCNGYRVCSCWGGCEWWNSNSELTPDIVALEQEMFCCEGDWPTGGDDPLSGGFFSEVPCDGPACEGDGDCEDFNECTDNICNAEGECEYINNTAFCENDGLFCNGEEICDGAGNCGHAGNPCAAGGECANVCNEDADNCYVEAGTICSDGDPCSEGDVCDAIGNCIGATTVSCDDSNVCTIDSCQDDGLGNATCVYAHNNGVGCDADDNPCTENDVCNGGVCNPGPLYDCSAFSTDCANGVCINDGAGNPSCVTQLLAEGTSCSDGLYCNGVDTCDAAGVCIHSGDPCATGGECDDNCNETLDNCFELSGVPCDADANACTPNDTCDGSGLCVADVAGAVDCSGESDQCNNSVCDVVTGLCKYQNDLLLGAQCNLDNNGCTNETCQGAGIDQPLTCTADSIETCADGNGCTDDICTSAGDFSYVCSNPGLPNTTACNFDSDGCTQNDHCDGAGACVAGNLVTGDTCAADLGLDVDCNTGLCNSDGDNAYFCSGQPIVGTSPGDCNADDNGCTLDSCVDSGNPLVGATCVVGAMPDCSALDGLPCTVGQCKATGFYDYDCQAVHEDSSVACNFDSSGCTVDDHCDGAGNCIAGVDAVCTPSECHTASCQTTGDNSYECSETSIENCCVEDADCSTLACPGSVPPVGCSQPTCLANTCVCQNEVEGTACSDYFESEFPSNCYDGFCNAAGVCTPTQHPAYNNLCSDAFVAGDPTLIDTAGDAYIGSISNDDVPGSENATLTVTGSTTCAYDNYQAGGTLCVEDDASTSIGDGGRDLVYAFSYQTNKSDDFNLYSYVIKVEATYDVGVYIKTNITSADECPEGNAPLLDDPNDGGFNGMVESSTCLLPFDDGVTPNPPPNVLEDECNTGGNVLYDQECCDPCAEGSTCGYKWCERGYPDGCDMCSGGCSGIWEYPEDPVDCSAEVPLDYIGYNYMASTIISPQGASDETWRTVFIFVDGVDGQEGDFHLTVSKKDWFAGPCDRVNDDMRVYDVTHPGDSGSTFLGSLEGVANSHHASGGSCGGYSCTAGWSGTSSTCHSSSSANQFWPNMESFKIHRSAAEGNAQYCIMTDETVTSSADLVLQLKYRYTSGATICDQGYRDVFSSQRCWIDNYRTNSVRKEFTAAADTLYLIWISQKSWTDRPCDPGSGDTCNYSLFVKEGACPAGCLSPNETLAGADVQMNATAYQTETRAGSVTGASGDDYYINSVDSNDDVYALYNNTGQSVSVTFEACGTGDAIVGLLDCEQTLLASSDSTGSGVCESFDYTVPSSSDPFYIVVDSHGPPSLGDYDLNVTWGTPPASCVPWSNWYSSPALEGTVTLGGGVFSLNPISGSTSGAHEGFDMGSTNSFKAEDEVWEIVVTADSTVRFSGCDDGGYGDYDGMLALVDCEGTVVTFDDDGCGGGRMSKFTVDLKAALSPYYLVVDGWKNDNGNYGFGLSYQ